MKTRPALRHGDFIKLHRRYKTEPIYKLSTTNLDDVFVVLRINGRSNKCSYTIGSDGKKNFPVSSDGHCKIEVLNIRTWERETFDRRQLWKASENWKSYRRSLRLQQSKYGERDRKFVPPTDLAL